MLTTTKVTINGQDSNMVVYVPDGATTPLPAFVFIPGIGEQNTDITGLYRHGPLNFIQGGWKPSFIVAGIQPAQGWPSPAWTDAMLKALISGFPVDTNRVCLTGLSAGASTIFDYVNVLPSNPSYLVPSCVVAFSYNLSVNPAWKDMPAWGLCGDLDGGFFPGMNGAWQIMNTNGWSNKPWTVMQGHGHDSWNLYYDPFYVDPGTKLTLYNWGLKFVSLGKITVPPPQTAPSPIGRIEAENWSAMSGVSTENAFGDTSGGKNVAYIDKGDWIEYMVDVPEDGQYTIDLRIATPNDGAVIQISQGGNIVGSVNVPKTGGYQNWLTTTATLSLLKGVQTIRLTSAAVPGWNINYFTIQKVATIAPPSLPVKKLINTITIKVYDDGTCETS